MHQRHCSIFHGLTPLLRGVGCVLDGGGRQGWSQWLQILSADTLGFCLYGPSVWSDSRRRMVNKINDSVFFCFSTVLNPMVGHTMNVLSLFTPVLCHSDWLFHGESCPRLDVVHPGCVWSSSPSCIVPCIISYCRQPPCFLMVWPQYASFFALTVFNSSLFTSALLLSWKKKLLSTP